MVHLALDEVRQDGLDHLALADAAGCSVLLVEEDDSEAFAVARLLRPGSNATFVVSRVASIESALSSLEKEDFAAVVLSLGTTRRHGLDTIQALLAAAPTTPIVVLAQTFDASDALKAVQAGAQDYLERSGIDPDNLGQAIRHAIERKRAETRLLYLAHHDSLTGLANRTLFVDRLERALDRAPESRARVAVLFIDLDRLKEINDTWGHEAGDRLLRLVARRLEDCVRNGETVARLGGDEFTIVLEGVRRLEDSKAVARRVQGCFDAPFDLGDGILERVGASIGVAISSESGSCTGDILERADRAMYRAKRDRTGGIEFFTDEPDLTTGDLFDISCEAERALAEGELGLVYQPKMSIEDGGMTGVEALLRWYHPRLGELSPASFISSFEEAGLIDDVGDWVLRTAVQQMSEWRRDHGLRFRMAVNVSAAQLDNRSFGERVIELLRDAELPPEYLEIEITESLLMEQSSRSTSTLNQLKRSGVRLAMDDFGTGYASLAYLVNVPLDVLKIDKSFIEDILSSDRHEAIVTAIIGLGRSLGLETVAEGVERQEQVELLRRLGCQAVQGYWLRRPEPASSILSWLDGAET